MTKNKNLLIAVLMGGVAISTCIVVAGKKAEIFGVNSEQKVTAVALTSENAPTNSVSYVKEVTYTDVKSATFTFKKVKKYAGEGTGLCSLDFAGSLEKDLARGLVSVTADYTGYLQVLTKAGENDTWMHYALTSGTETPITGNYVKLLAKDRVDLKSVSFKFACESGTETAGSFVYYWGTGDGATTYDDRKAISIEDKYSTANVTANGTYIVEGEDLAAIPTNVFCNYYPLVEDRPGLASGNKAITLSREDDIYGAGCAGSPARIAVPFMTNAKAKVKITMVSSYHFAYKLRDFRPLFNVDGNYITTPDVEFGYVDPNYKFTNWKDCDLGTYILDAGHHVISLEKYWNYKLAASAAPDLGLPNIDCFKIEVENYGEDIAAFNFNANGTTRIEMNNPLLDTSMVEIKPSIIGDWVKRDDISFDGTYLTYNNAGVTSTGVTSGLCMDGLTGLASHIKFNINLSKTCKVELINHVGYYQTISGLDNYSAFDIDGVTQDSANYQKGVTCGASAASTWYNFNSYSYGTYELSAGNHTLTSVLYGLGFVLGGFDIVITEM